MIARVLFEHRKKEEEDKLIERTKKMWFYKVNEDNIHPIYKPFTFKQNQIIDAEYKKKDIYEEAIHAIHIKKEGIRVFFETELKKPYVEIFENGVVVRKREAKYEIPRDIMKNYLRNKKYENRIFEKIIDKSDTNKFILLNMMDIITFQDNYGENLKNFANSFKNFTFIITKNFQNIIDEKKEIFKEKSSKTGLLEFIEDELVYSFKRSNLEIYIDKLTEFKEDRFDEEKFCNQIINIYSLEGPLNYKVNHFFDKEQNNSTDKDFLLFILLFFYSLNYFEKNTTDIYVYRVLSSKNCERECKKGDLISLTQFFSASKDIEEAIKYINEEPEEFKENNNDKIVNNLEDEHKVIFQIKIRKEKNIMSPIVCGIKKYSEFPFEDEYILAPNNIFKVYEVIHPSKSAINKENKFITVKLTLQSSYFLESNNLGIYNETDNSDNLNIILDLDSNAFYKESFEKSNDEKNSDYRKLEPKINFKKKYNNLQYVILRNINTIENWLFENTFIENVKNILDNSPNLKNIDLSLNSLTSANLEIIMEKFKDLNELSNIILANNEITCLEKICSSIKGNCLNEKGKIINRNYQNIIQIDLSYNKLNSKSIKDLSKVLKFFNLQKIDLSFNKIKFDGAKALVEKLNETPNLQYLDLSNNNLYSEEYEFETVLSKNFQLVKHLHTLNLQRCNLSSESVKIITDEFVHLPNLEVINFSCNQIDENDYIGTISLANQFKNINKLKSIDLSFNSIGSLGIGGFKTLFMNIKNLPDLQHLLLQENFIGFSQNYDVLYLNLIKLSNLVTINFNSLEIGDIGANALGTVLSKNLKFLEVLKLDNNKISSKGFNSLHLKNQTNLQVLSLNYNELSEKTIFDTINFDSLKKLYLSNNKLKSEGIKNLFKNIVKIDNNKIEEINISSNEIDLKPDSNKIKNFKIIENVDEKLINFEDNSNENNHHLWAGINAVISNLEKLKNIKILNFSSNVLNFYSLRLISDKKHRKYIQDNNIQFFVNNCDQSKEITANISRFKDWYIDVDSKDSEHLTQLSKLIFL